jgi:hypothetical protein
MSIKEALEHCLCTPRPPPTQVPSLRFPFALPSSENHCHHCPPLPAQLRHCPVHQSPWRGPARSPLSFFAAAASSMPLHHRRDRTLVKLRLCSVLGSTVDRSTVRSTDCGPSPLAFLLEKQINIPENSRNHALRPLASLQILI